MSETTSNICPHCDMGMVDVGGPQVGGPYLVKCYICHGDWRNYVKKPAPRPSSWPSEEELRKLYQQPMAEPFRQRLHPPSPDSNDDLGRQSSE
jgi:hypothetical protein